MFTVLQTIQHAQWLDCLKSGFLLTSCNIEGAGAQVDYRFPSVRTHGPSQKHLPKHHKQAVSQSAPAFYLLFFCLFLAVNILLRKPFHIHIKKPPSQLMTVVMMVISLKLSVNPIF